MLIEFRVGNFRSFNELQSLNMTAGSGSEVPDDNTFTVRAAKEHELLRAAAIYGPNASGKSNFIRALEVMEQIVRESASGQQRGDKLPVVPFRLSKDTELKPSEFDVVFIADNVRYRYGFTATQERVHEEWLEAYPKGFAQTWFHREWDKDSRQYRWNYSSTYFFGEKQLWQKSTRENALFLSTAVQLNSEQLQPVFDWFVKKLYTVRMGGWSSAFTASLCEEQDKVKILDFLHAADISIDDIRVERRPFDPTELPADMPEPTKTIIRSEMDGVEVTDIRTIHKTQDGRSVEFEMADESDGTRRIFSFAGPLIDSLEKGHIVCIDEIHNSLHPKLVEFLVRLFHSTRTNPNNAQLIFTTHETSVLTQKLFRRDQIWFCEKDSKHASSLFPLTDFRPRKGRENLELAYLSGRYGALPFIARFPSRESI